MTTPTSLWGSEPWARRLNEENRNRVAEIRFHRAVKDVPEKIE
jgi:hypothetical protein